MDGVYLEFREPRVITAIWMSNASNNMDYQPLAFAQFAPTSPLYRTLIFRVDADILLTWSTCNKCQTIYGNLL